VTISARVCGALCGESRTPTDYTGMDCAIAARIRLMPATHGAPPLAEHCVSFQPDGTTPPAHRPADLFDTGARGGNPLSLGRPPSVPFSVEVALYAPGSLPCQDDQPLVGLGISGLVDPGQQSGDVAVPIGCRDACETHGNVMAQLLSVEDLTTPVGTPADLALGEIFPYATMTATGGVCMTPPLTAHQGLFRSFNMTRAGANLDGVWIVDFSMFDGCTVLAGTSNGARQLSCLSDASTSKSTLQGYVVDAAHAQAVSAFNQSVHASTGALVIRVLDPLDGDANGSAIGAHVAYALLSTLSEAEYTQDASWAIATPTPGGTTAEGLGVAVIADAPTGPYTITFSDGMQATMNAGGAEDPHAITVAVVRAQR
jgi:hypothetical protein